MDYLLAIGCVVLFLYAMCSQIFRCVDLQREKEIIKRGHPVHGKVEKIRYRLINRSFARENCTPVVSFSWEFKHYRLDTLTTVPHRKYKIGSVVELLFLPEYPNKVVIKDDKPTSSWGLFVDTIIMLFFAVGIVIALVNLWP
jgi:hypothetical protein